MSQLRVARRYAEALIETAEAEKNVDSISEDMTYLRRVARESREFALFLRSPVIAREKKQTVLSGLFEKTLHPLSIKFLLLLAEKGREGALLQIIEDFFTFRDERLGIVGVNVRAASDLSKEHLGQLEKKFAGFTKKKVRLDVSIDKTLRGGFVARVGDTMYDGSVKRQLELLRERFATGTIK
ncbi:MAG: ATP synthase F1 subunit delta [Bacteroidota bacterium]